MAQPAYHESLPYIDPEPSPDALAAARALISAEQESSLILPAEQSPLPPLRDPSFSPLVAAELARIAESSESSKSSKSPSSKTKPPGSSSSGPETKSSGLDLARYEAQDDIPNGPLRAPLQTAAVSSAYLASRAQNLHLLDRHGRNAWLVGNYYLDAHLRALEADLAAARRDVDLVNAARARAQADVRAEMDGLADAWRTGVGRVLETEIAVEEVRGRIREELRAAAAAGAQAGA